ncbi:MAG: helix-turn-helix transcriptional regulator [Flaviflexus sp.]|nr:helix-turn-helix transcriptional regulator [Flaviflexus sp.]
MNRDYEVREIARAIGAICARHRKKTGLSQEKFAVMAGINPKHFQTIEAGVNSKGGSANPQLGTLAAMCRGLEIPLPEFIDEVWEYLRERETVHNR